MMKQFAACLVGMMACMSAYSSDAGKGTDDPVYSPAYFWLWNDRLDTDRLCSQLEDMCAHGLRNVCIHPMPKAFRPAWCSTKMAPDYLTPEFIEVYARTSFHSIVSRWEIILSLKTSVALTMVWATYI